MLLSQPCPIFIIIYNLILVGRVLHFSGSLLLKKNKRRASELLARNHYICTIADCEQSLFSSGARERAPVLSSPFHYAPGHFPVSRVSLEGLRKKRDCS